MIKTKTVQIITISDWNKLVRETYGRPYNFQQQEGCKPRGTFYFSVPDRGIDDDFENDTISEALIFNDEEGVSFSAWLARDPTKKLPKQKRDYELEMWWERKFWPCVGMIIDDLHTKGLLEIGEYGIEIDW